MLAVDLTGVWLCMRAEIRRMLAAGGGAIVNTSSTGVVTEAEIAAMQPVDRPADPVEIAEAAAWLLADHASFVTGQALAVDGGLVAR